ncbi:MAG TPA: hypothetical protein VFI44_10295 [Ornithinibacter sp.]|nr:hypothetical protein [Ornithinibacter sp.]
MKQIEVRVWIERPVGDVYAYVTTLDTWPEWRRDVVEGRLLTEGPMRVGSQARGVGRILGRPLTIDIGLNGAYRVLLPMMPALVRSGYRKNLASLKATLEAQPV